MRKLLLTISLALLLPQLAGAWTPRFSYGLEWGYTGTFLKTAQHNFICNEGYRIIENPTVLRYFSNGLVMAGAGADLGNNLNLSVYSGVQGIYSERLAIPLEMRVKWCPGGLHADGLLLMAGSGLSFPVKYPRETGFIAQAGGGYRIVLNRTMSVDLTARWNFTLDHEDIIDPDTRRTVPRSLISSNTAEYQAINLSIALNF